MNKTVDLTNTPSANGNPKALFITALPLEYKAVKRHLRSVGKVTHESGTVYEFGEFKSKKQSWTVWIVETGAGNNPAAIETERALNYIRPTVAFFSGVAGGVKDVELGDVVAGSKAYGYESGKQKGFFLPRPEAFNSSYPLVQIARLTTKSHQWRKRIGKVRYRKPVAMVGPIAAGEKVIASSRSALSKFIKLNYNDTVAVDMEARGFLNAAYANPTALCLVVRGVSDLLSKKGQSDRAGWQPRAAKHASAFAFEVLDQIAPVGLPHVIAGTYFVVITGKLDRLNSKKLRSIEARLQRLSGDYGLEIRKVSSGSIRLHIRGTLAGYTKLKGQFSIGAFKKFNRHRVLGVDGFLQRGKPSLDVMLSQALFGESEAKLVIYSKIRSLVKSRILHWLHRTRFEREDIEYATAAEIFASLNFFPGSTYRDFRKWVIRKIQQVTREFLGLRQVALPANSQKLKVQLSLEQMAALSGVVGPGIFEATIAKPKVESASHISITVKEVLKAMNTTEYFSTLIKTKNALQIGKSASHLPTKR